ncbi:uncharacterized protein LOC129586825 [Paramacrobiotus metropolitanus]|uniref:uncharacterized protein LOC129586825 n=1 Tax=Paramacrobiotus metropolitanus TaxID=2943436 RepID=UPI002445F4B6|nr:uncharacterized protein LOC129586825 [Paramacrobiotus metropolitanus]
MDPQSGLCAPVSPEGHTSHEKEKHHHKTGDPLQSANANYVWWCVAHHGQDLSPSDPNVYEKIASLLLVMAGVKVPAFVVELLRFHHQMASNKADCSAFHELLSLDILRKLEIMRRKSASGSQREFAVLLGEIMTTIYRNFYETLKQIPDEIVLQSMSNLLTGYWSKHHTPRDTISHPSIMTMDLENQPSTTEAKTTNTTENVVQPSHLQLPIQSAQYQSTLMPQSQETLKIQSYLLRHPMEENVIEVQFTLNGLANGRDAQHSLHPVMSGTSIVQEPTVDTGEHHHRSRGIRHAGWKRLRRLGRLVHEAMGPRNTTPTVPVESADFRYGFTESAITHASRVSK